MVTATWRKTSRKRPGCAQAKRSAAEQATAELVRRVRVGVATDAALAAPQTDVACERADLVVLAERLALRKEYLAKGTAADELARRLEVTQDLQAGRQALDVARLTLDAARKAAAVGTGSQIEMRQADLALQERQLELARLAERLRRLEAVPPRDRAQSDSGGGDGREERRGRRRMRRSSRRQRGHHAGLVEGYPEPTQQDERGTRAARRWEYSTWSRERWELGKLLVGVH